MIYLVIMLFMIPFLFLYGTWAWAVVLKDTVNWFMVPTFSISPISFVQAIAISAVVSIFITKVHLSINSEPDFKKKYIDESGDIKWNPLFNTVLTGIVAPWITLFFAWLTKIIFI